MSMVDDFSPYDEQESILRVTAVDDGSDPFSQAIDFVLGEIVSCLPNCSTLELNRLRDVINSELDRRSDAVSSRAVFL